MFKIANDPRGRISCSTRKMHAQSKQGNNNDLKQTSCLNDKLKTKFTKYDLTNIILIRN